MIASPVWTQQQLEDARRKAIEHFREGRGTEPLEAYIELFDEYQGIVEEFMEQTLDLTRLEENAEELLSDPKKREVFRYVTGPPVSEDDLKVLVEATSLSRRQIVSNPELVSRLVNFARDWHDRRRFPWIGANYTPAEHERNAAILATTALLAMRKLETLRRSTGKEIQELLVASTLTRAGLIQVETRTVNTLAQAPGPGEFCREALLGTRKADFIIGLWDGRTMPVECKVSNSELNSIKRLNNDAAVKAEVWRDDFGRTQIVPCAVLGGAYKLSHLENAQTRGLTLFWAHDLQHMVDWMLSTRTTNGASSQNKIS